LAPWRARIVSCLAVPGGPHERNPSSRRIRLRPPSPHPNENPRPPESSSASDLATVARRPAARAQDFPLLIPSLPMRECFCHEPRASEDHEGGDGATASARPSHHSRLRDRRGPSHRRRGGARQRLREQPFVSSGSAAHRRVMHRRDQFLLLTVLADGRARHVFAGEPRRAPPLALAVSL
jgi:hypothetical protein